MTLGMPWAEVENAGDFTELTRPATAWEQHIYDCGYRSARFAMKDGSLLVTAQDHVVTALSHTTTIERGSDVMKVAGRVIENYGRPRQATLRDELGAVTIEQTRTHYALLEYRATVDAAFAISGDPLWEYRITVNDRNTRRLENRTIRCARTREKESAATAISPRGAGLSRFSAPDQTGSDFPTSLPARALSVMPVIRTGSTRDGASPDPSSTRR